MKKAMSVVRFAYRPESLSEADAKLMRECARGALKAASCRP